MDCIWDLVFIFLLLSFSLVLFCKILDLASGPYKINMLFLLSVIAFSFCKIHFYNLLFSFHNLSYTYKILLFYCYLYLHFLYFIAIFFVPELDGLPSSCYLALYY